VRGGVDKKEGKGREPQLGATPLRGVGGRREGIGVGIENDKI
jgi:hypothetical protein